MVKNLNITIYNGPYYFYNTNHCLYRNTFVDTPGYGQSRLEYKKNLYFNIF